MAVSIPQVLTSAQGSVTPPQSQGVPSAPAPAATASPKATDSSPPPPPPSSEQIQKAVEQMKRAVSSVASNLQFSVDEGTGQTVIRVVDSTTDEVIRQIPSEEMLQLAQDLSKMQGMLLKQKA